MIADKPKVLFDAWHLLEKEQKLSNKEAFEALLMLDFNIHILHELRTDFPQSIPQEIGDIFHLKNEHMRAVAPAAPYISYDLGTSLIRYIQSRLPEQNPTFSLLNIQGEQSKNNNFVRFLEKFNIRATSYQGKRPKNLFGLFGGQHKISEDLIISEKESNHDVAFLWESPTKEQFSAIHTYWMTKEKPFFFVGKENNHYFYNEKFKHPELGEYCVFAV